MAFYPIEFVALQTALAAELIDEALAALALIVPAQAGGQGYRQAEQLGVALPAQLTAAEAAVQLDHAAAGIQRVTGKGEKLLHVALAAVNHHGDLIVVGQAALVVGAQLLMADALAGVEQLGLGDGLLAVGVQRCSGQPERVLGVRLIQRIEQQGQAGGVVNIPAQAQVGHVSAGVAVITVAVGFQSREVGGNVQIAVLAAVLEARAPEAVAADAAAVLQRWKVAAFAAEALDDATRRIAIQAAQRAAQHLDAVEVVQVEQPGLALAVGHGQRNAVLQQAHAAYAELGAGAEPTGRNLHILRVVLAIERQQPRHPLQRLGQVGAQVGCWLLIEKQCAACQRQGQLMGVVAGAKHCLGRQLNGRGLRGRGTQ